MKRSIIKEQKDDDSKAASADRADQCLKAALGMLSYRPRSEKEVRTKLGRRFDSKVIDNTLIQLKKMKLIDDAAFAEYWRRRREAHSPRSRKLVGAELRQKGIDRELIGNVTSDIDDEENAYRAAQKKASALTGDGFTVFRRKLSSFLYRKGFSYEVAAHTVNRLWREFS